MIYYYNYCDENKRRDFYSGSHSVGFTCVYVLNFEGVVLLFTISCFRGIYVLLMAYWNAITELYDAKTLWNAAHYISKSDMYSPCTGFTQNLRISDKISQLINQQDTNFFLSGKLLIWSAF